MTRLSNAVRRPSFVIPLVSDVKPVRQPDSAEARARKAAGAKANAEIEKARAERARVVAFATYKALPKPEYPYVFTARYYALLAWHEQVRREAQCSRGQAETACGIVLRKLEYPTLNGGKRQRISEMPLNDTNYGGTASDGDSVYARL